MVKVVADSTELPVSGQMECSCLQITIRPERIHFLKFILEGYDGLAIQSTVDAKTGVVEIRYPPEMKQDLQNLLTELKPLIAKSSVKN